MDDVQPLKPDEVAVTPQQFQELVRIANIQDAEVLSPGEAAEKMLAICPRLQKFRTNYLVIEYAQPRWL
jgi:hypothetical protein